MRTRRLRYRHPFGVLLDLGDGREISGQINLSEHLGDNAASLYDKDDFTVQRGSSLCGTCQYGMVSLLDCYPRNRVVTQQGSAPFFRSDLSFRYAVFGTRHLCPEERTIRSIHFTFAEIDAILSNRRFDAFGQLLDPHDDIIDAIERNRPDHQTGSFRKNGSAMVFYFTGKHELLPQTPTPLGAISATRTLHIDAASPTVEDVPYITIDFDDHPATLAGAFQKMMIVRQFCAWMIGYTPRWKDVRVFTGELVDGAYRTREEGHPDTGLEVFAPMRVGGDESEGNNGSWPDALIDASQDPDHFMAVMKVWLERNSDPQRMRANNRFFGSMSGMPKRTVEDGICAAANTFDLLPPSDKPNTAPISHDIKDILREAGKRIKKLPNLEHSEREEVLNQLGRIRAYVNLRQVIEPRADLVLQCVGERTLPHMDRVIRAAVLCRNYFTHGTDDGRSGDVDIADPSVALFLTRSLRCVYAMSELLSCGWDFAGWIQSVRMNHFFARYLTEYNGQIQRIGLHSAGD